MPGQHHVTSPQGLDRPLSARRRDQRPRDAAPSPMELRPPEPLRLRRRDADQHRPVRQRDRRPGLLQVLLHQRWRDHRQQARLPLEARALDVGARRRGHQPPRPRLRPGPPAHLLGSGSSLSRSASGQHQPHRPPVPRWQHLMRVSRLDPPRPPQVRQPLVRRQRLQRTLRIRLRQQLRDVSHAAPRCARQDRARSPQKPIGGHCPAQSTPPAHQRLVEPFGPLPGPLGGSWPSSPPAEQTPSGRPPAASP